MNRCMIFACLSLSVACVSPVLEARAMVLANGDDEAGQIVQISTSQLQDKEKFTKILKIALEAKGGKRGGPDVVFSKRPNWYSYLMPFVENAESYGGFGPYRGADLSFLKKWSQAKKYDKFRNHLVGLGYIDDRGMPKKNSIRADDVSKLMQFASSLYDE